jgi:hypothetical protein
LIKPKKDKVALLEVSDGGPGGVLALSAPPPATEKIGAMGHEIDSGVGWQLLQKINRKIFGSNPARV